MSDTNQTIPVYPPSNPNRTVDKDGYWASFYPGFVRRMSVWSDDGRETLLYEQPTEGWESRFYLPPGYTKPWPVSTLEFTRPDGRRLLLQIDDPSQQVDSIVVTLKGDASAAPSGVQAVSGIRLPVPSLGAEPPPPPPPPPPGGVVLVVEDGPVLCPPACPL